MLRAPLKKADGDFCSVCVPWYAHLDTLFLQCSITAEYSLCSNQPCSVPGVISSSVVGHERWESGISQTFVRVLFSAYSTGNG